MVDPRRRRGGRMTGDCNHEIGKAQVFRLSSFISDSEKELRVQVEIAAVQGVPACMLKTVAIKEAVL